MSFRLINQLLFCNASLYSHSSFLFVRRLRRVVFPTLWFTGYQCSKIAMAQLHFKCRGSNEYAKSGVNRLPVPDDKVSWSVDWPEYSPPTYTLVLSKPWEDPDIGDPSFNPKWNALDGAVNRQSHMATEYVVQDGFPLNPIGRTGLKGKGILGRWGPNHAADPLVTRWKRKSNGSMYIDSETQKPILQFVAIKRKDCGEWAIPGGMVDPGEVVSATLKREFMEEAVDSLSLEAEDREALEKKLESTFKDGKEIYRGYVDDPRNSDNSWMETVVYNFHDDSCEAVGRFPLHAGDDAADVRWTDIDKNLSLYASHAAFVKQVVAKHQAHW